MKHEGAGFDRSKSCWDRSWALRRFKYHHGELNRSYWSDVVARQHTARALAGVPDDVQTAAHLNLLGPDAQRPPRTVGELKVALAETGNWARLNATMALASYFEVYVSTIVTLAIESDPGALIGLRGQVDGTILLKSMPKYSQAQAAIPSVKGTWQERVQYLQRLFGPVPAGLAGLVTELEKLRKFRNGVGHAFGRDLDQSPLAVELVPRPALRVSEDRLKKWLGVVDTAAAEIDRHLLRPLGAYELLRLYHDWPKRATGHWSDHARPFKKSVGSVAGSNNPGIKYSREAIGYYRNVSTA